MAFCTKCGGQLPEQAEFCPACGQPTAAQQAAQPQAAQPQGQSAPAPNTGPQGQGQGQEKPGGAPFQPGANPTAQGSFAYGTDETAHYAADDIARNKGIAIVGYISILFLVPLLAAKDSPFAQFHARQGGLLFLCSTVLGLGLMVLQAIFHSFLFYPLHVLLSVLQALVSLFFLALMVVGIVNVANGKAVRLPILDKIFPRV